MTLYTFRMATFSRYNPSDRIIETQASGNITIYDIKKSLGEIMRLSLEHDCYLWLNDFTGSTLAVPMFQIMNYVESLPAFLEKTGDKKYTIRRTVVRNEQDERYFFFETTSHNRGRIPVFSATGNLQENGFFPETSIELYL